MAAEVQGAEVEDCHQIDFARSNQCKASPWQIANDTDKQSITDQAPLHNVHKHTGAMSKANHKGVSKYKWQNVLSAKLYSSAYGAGLCRRKRGTGAQQRSSNSSTTYGDAIDSTKQCRIKSVERSASPLPAATSSLSNSYPAHPGNFSVTPSSDGLTIHSPLMSSVPAVTEHDSILQSCTACRDVSLSYTCHDCNMECNVCSMPCNTLPIIDTLHITRDMVHEPRDESSTYHHLTEQRCEGLAVHDHAHMQSSIAQCCHTRVYKRFVPNLPRILEDCHLLQPLPTLLSTHDVQMGTCITHSPTSPSTPPQTTIDDHKCASDAAIHGNIHEYHIQGHLAHHETSTQNCLTSDRTISVVHQQQSAISYPASTHGGHVTHTGGKALPANTSKHTNMQYCVSCDTFMAGQRGFEALGHESHTALCNTVQGHRT
jgi:hypothetical protein